MRKHHEYAVCWGEYYRREFVGRAEAVLFAIRKSFDCVVDVEECILQQEDDEAPLARLVWQAVYDMGVKIDETDL